MWNYKMLLDPRMKYVIFDGDNIGDALATVYLTNNETALREIDSDIRDRMQKAEHYLKSEGFTMIACGADGITCKRAPVVPMPYFAKLALIVSPYTFSIGYGDSLREAFFCLRYAKASGRNRWAHVSSAGTLESHPCSDLTEQVCAK
jgi:hypothetical protein